MLDIEGHEGWVAHRWVLVLGCTQKGVRVMLHTEGHEGYVAHRWVRG